MVSNAEKQRDREQSANFNKHLIHESQTFKVVQNEITFSPKETKTYDLVIHPGAVALIPIQNDGKILLVHQWRRAAQKILLELPAGTLEVGETPLECASRELREETGYRAKAITPLTGFFSAPGILSEFLHLYLAENLVEDPLIGDDTEEIDLVSLTLEECLEKIQAREIIDAKTILGLLWINHQK